MLEIDQQVARMLELVIERKLKLNRLGQEKCLDNEDDEDDRKCDEKLREQTHDLEVECFCIE